MVELECIRKAVSQTAKPYGLTAVERGDLETRAYSHALVVCKYCIIVAIGSTTMERFPTIVNTSQPESANVLPRHWPVFGTQGDNIEIIQLPTEFHQVLLDMIRGARRFVTLVSLDLGSEQTDIVEALHASLREKPELNVHVLLDSLYKPQALGMLAKLKQEFDGRCRLSFFESPTAARKVIIKRILTTRVDEVLGVQHMKCYLFDNDVIIGGANLNTAYLTNRQDRYIRFKNNTALTQFYYDLTNTLGDVSHHPVAADDPNGSSYLSPDQKKESIFKKAKLKLDTKKTFKKVSKALQDFVHRWQHKVSINEGDDTVLVPTMQLGFINLRQDEALFEELLGTTCVPNTISSNVGITGEEANVANGNRIVDDEGGGDGKQDNTKDDVNKWRVVLSSPYFNFPPHYRYLLLRSNELAGTKFKIMTAAPKCTELGKEEGLAKHVPSAYTYLEYRFLHPYNIIKKNKKQKDFVLEEYGREGWTFHGKGIWLYAPGDPLPCATTVGSSNFNKRSLKRDFEASLCILTNNRSLQQRIHDNLEFMRQSATPVDEEILQSKERKANFIIRSAAFLAKDML
ncbi:CDP-diacylglycerol---glycerol-3-phosphate 1-phosphatidyltransferase [Synchytrium endobioticum]|uniref:CDP-diacylglycerol--glycerol-3-phosphate 3-phosphatidyltransferase n=1 Tax=Synchytrium endobioticum TaxID=286115 RepID=A0A507DCV3_9FUNG|nr:CDP-diacylglycerol---glycerol-3-phosphate 1-phosphatidyltransferase [Synchytrium endobioticum]